MIDVRPDQWMPRPAPGTYKITPLSKTTRLVKYCCHKCSKVASLPVQKINDRGIVPGFACASPRCAHAGSLKLRGWYVMEFRLQHWENGPGIPGTWYKDDQDRLWICCPKCKRIGTLNGTHEADADGNVTPSLICSRDSCDFHETIKLADYE